MPKPFMGLTGNGCHAHISVWDKTGKTNMFYDPSDEMGLSQQGYHFLGGIMRHAEVALGHHQPDRQLLQADQRAAHNLGRDVGAKLRHLDGQQPHAHGTRAGQGSL